MDSGEGTKLICAWNMRESDASFSIVGFLFGFSLASSFAAYRLMEEYQQASAALQSSVDKLAESTERVRDLFWQCLIS